MARAFKGVQILCTQSTGGGAKTEKIRKKTIKCSQPSLMNHVRA